MKDLVVKNEYAAFLLVVTNILTSDSEGLLVGSEDFMQHAEQAFGGQEWQPNCFTRRCIT